MKLINIRFEKVDVDKVLNQITVNYIIEHIARDPTSSVLMKHRLEESSGRGPKAKKI